MATAKQRAYAAAMSEVVKRYAAVDGDTHRQIITLVNELRRDIASELLTGGELSALRVQQLNEQLVTRMTQFESLLKGVARDGVSQAVLLGGTAVIAPLQAAGVAAFAAPTPALLNTLADFSADLITNISRETLTKINTQIRMGSLGQRSTLDIMREIDKILGTKAGRKQLVKGVGVRAEMILRTERGRAFSMSTQAQLEATAAREEGMLKTWLATGDFRTRESHLAAHVKYNDKPIPFDKPFIVGGQSLMFPRDPGGSAKETINCRCKHIAIHPDIGVLPSTLTPKIEREIMRRKDE